jgi:hypothetical protein
VVCHAADAIGWARSASSLIGRPGAPFRVSLVALMSLMYLTSLLGPALIQF